MSAKVMKSMKEENPELQKQIGCVHGFFQLFDRHRFLIGQRNSSQIQNSVTPSGRKSHHTRELNSTNQKATVKNHRASREKQQFFTESSRTPVSSLEISRTVQIEAPSVTQTRFPESPIAVMKQFNIRSQQSLGLPVIVRDSMHRETQGLSVKTVARKEKGHHGLKYIDSPRPLQSPKCVHNGVMTRNESLHALSRSQKTSWDSPRLSYDGRDTQDSFKYSMKHKEPPRLSLDSRERSMRGLNEGTKSRKGQQRGYGLDQLQEPETSKRSSGVVAKLMGLEAFPDQAQTCESPYRTTTCSMVKKESSARSTKESNPSLSVYGEIEKRLKELEFKKSGKDLRALKQILEAMQRYKDSLDFKGDKASNSSFDTRNDSGLSESSIVQSPRHVQKKGPISQGDKSQIVIMKPSKAASKTKNPASTDPFFPGKSVLNILLPGSPPAGRLLDKQTAKCSAIKSNNKTNSKLRVSQDINGERFSSSSGNKSRTESPRLQQKRFGVERRSRPTSPSSDSNSNRRQHKSQSIESSSPSTTSRLKISTSQKGIEHLSKPNGHRKNSRKNVDLISPDFDSRNYADTQVIHINDSDKNTSFRMHALNQNTGTKETSDNIPMVETTLVISEQPSPVSVLDTTFYQDDPPSPVKKRIYSSKNSDEALNTDERENSADFPHLANTTDVQFSNEANDRDLNTKHSIQMLGHIDCPHEEPIYLDGTYRYMKEPDHKYIAKILLASGLLSGTSSSRTIHSLGHPINPRLFFALEQIKTTKGASGIEDSAKKMVKTSNPEKMRRKLIFDVVNDILVQKLALETSSTQWFQLNKLTGRKPKGQQLLNEICSEIDQLSNNKNASLADEDKNTTKLLQGDPILHPTIWTDSYIEIPDTVLDIERLIFKDLITDIVRDEATKHHGRYCRKQLFP